ncbi:MAG: F0F1 ATP synthase subunit epsilon [Deltaproteobacteria bacterium]|nr:F0F1 ATP synthase subunit epsilon [Deltaproteobacteria bacterium]
MADNFLLEIVTPYRKLLSKEVDELTAPGAEGEFGVLAGHTPFLTVLKPGELSFKKGSEAVHIAVAKGYAEVLPDKTTILVDSAEFAEDINLEAARELCAKSEEALKKLNSEDPEYSSASDAYELAQARIRVKERQRG